MNAEHSRLPIFLAIAAGMLVCSLLCCGCMGWFSGEPSPSHVPAIVDPLEELSPLQREYANQLIEGVATNELSLSNMKIGDIGKITPPMINIQIIGPAKLLCTCDSKFSRRQFIITGVPTEDLVSDGRYYWSKKYVFGVVKTEEFTTVTGAGRSVFRLERVNTPEVESAVQAKLSTMNVEKNLSSGS